MLIELGGLALGDTVLFNDPNKGWVPAVIERIHKPEKESVPPHLSLVILITGFHGGTYPKEFVKHGSDKSEWLTRAEAKVAVAKAEALKQEQLGNAQAAAQIIADLAKQEVANLKEQTPPEPSAPEPKEPEKQKAKAAK